MVIKIDFVKNESKKARESAESSKTESSLEIKNPKLAKAIDDLQRKKDNKEPMTVREQLRLGRLKKYGDKAQNLSKAVGNKPSKVPDLPSLNNNPAPDTPHKLHKIIDAIYDGSTLIQACNIYNTSPKQFLKELEKGQNSSLRSEFLLARICLAEYYLERRESLERDLRAGRIDPSTYSCLSSDYKYLAGKLAPLAYGDKIQLDATVAHVDTAPSQETLKELNKLLSNTIEADYTVEQ